jgi:hypothetical protein
MSPNQVKRLSVHWDGHGTLLQISEGKEESKVFFELSDAVFRKTDGHTNLYAENLRTPDAL